VEYSTSSLPGGDLPPADGTTTYYLVSPAGRKYAFYVTPSQTPYPRYELVDWSGDRRRILIQRTSGSTERSPYEQVSLATGTVLSRFILRGNVLAADYARPDGDSLIVMTYRSPAGVFRYDLAGHPERRLAGGYFSSMLESPGGSYVVAGTQAGLDVISGTGGVIRRLRVPARVILCGPVRWWSGTTLLAYCVGKGPYSTERLWLFPLDGARPTPLTPALRPHGLFSGYVDAWRIGGRLYLQADNAHDTLSIVQQFRGGSRRTIRIPGPAGVSDCIVTARAGRLLLQSAIGPGGPSSLFWFSPPTHAVRFVFRTPAGTYGVAGVIPYGSG
jgi:hypothetical protein